MTHTCHAASQEYRGGGKFHKYISNTIIILFFQMRCTSNTIFYCNVIYIKHAFTVLSHKNRIWNNFRGVGVGGMGWGWVELVVVVVGGLLIRPCILWHMIYRVIDYLDRLFQSIHLYVHPKTYFYIFKPILYFRMIRYGVADYLLQISRLWRKYIEGMLTHYSPPLGPLR